MNTPSGDVVKWAYEYTNVDLLDDLVTAAGKLSQTNAQDPLFYHAKAIVLAVQRYKSVGNAYEMPADITGQTPFQSLLLFLLRRLHELQYRRHGDSCYARIKGCGKEPTFAFERVCSIREFIVAETRKETEPEQWKNLTNPRDNLDILVRHLSEIEHAEFKSLVVDGSLTSFQNGTYSIADNVFWPHDRVDEWNDFAKEVEEERRAQGWGNAYHLEPPDPNVCTATYIDRQFRLCDEHNKGAIEAIRRLLSRIGIDTEAHGWLFVLFGRLLFPIAKKDKWSVMPFFKTAESADNTAIGVLKGIYETLIGAESVAQVASGVNVQHSLETLMHARVCAVLLREQLPLEQGDWQSILSGEHVCINPTARSRSSFSHQWTSHLFAVGPCFGYKNDAGTVDRRVIMFDVSNASTDDFRELGNLVHDNIDLWLQTIVDAYLTAAHEHSMHDIWAPNVLPQSILSSRESLRELVTPLLSCARSSLFTLDTHLFMPLSDFKDIYYDFRRRRGLPAQRWIREHWQATFLDLGLTIERSQREYRGMRSTTDWLIGLDATVNSHGQSLIVTRDMIAQLEADETRLEAELRRVRDKLEIARQLCDMEDEVNRLKTLRLDLRLRYEEILD